MAISTQGVTPDDIWRILRERPDVHGYELVNGELAEVTQQATNFVDTFLELERRLIAMTKKNRPPRRAWLEATGLCALLLATAACDTELPTAAAIEDMDVADVQARAAHTDMFFAWPGDGAPVFIIDGVPATEREAHGLAPDEIARIEILKRHAATMVGGAQRAHGVIRITTRAGAAAQSASGPGASPLDQRESGIDVAESDSRTTIRIRGQGPAVFGVVNDAAGIDTPLIIVDGVKADDSFSLGRLSPATIERIEIVKGPAAQQLYDDPRATNGVILITTKEGGR